MNISSKQPEIRIFHFSDLHARITNIDKIKAVFKSIVMANEEKPFDLILFTGDLFDGECLINKNSPLYTVIDGFKRLAKICPVYILQGTPSHDRSGNLDILKHIRNTENEFPITVMDSPTPIGTTVQAGAMGHHPEYYVWFYPIPGIVKSHWIAQTSKTFSTDDVDEITTQLLKEMLMGYKIDLEDRRKASPNTIGIMPCHLTVTGAKTSAGHILVGNDMVINVGDLTIVGAEVIPGGHIHKSGYYPPNFYYSGSTFPHNWGEVEIKSAWIYEIKPGELTNAIKWNFPFPPMVDLEVDIWEPFEVGVTNNEGYEFEVLNNDSSYGDELDFETTNPEVRLRIHLPPEMAEHFGEEDALKFLKTFDLTPSKLQFEKVIKNTDRPRSKKMGTLRSNQDKLKEYCDVTNTNITKGMMTKLEKIEEEL